MSREVLYECRSEADSCLAAPSRVVPPEGPGATHGISDREVAEFLRHAGRPVAAEEQPPSSPGTEPDVRDQIYNTLTHRRFSALSRGKAHQYRQATLEALADSFKHGEPIEFWFDVGPGYRASLRPGALPLSFEVGLGELLMLTQVAVFLDRVTSFYPPGARFRLVVDNLCALRTNDIPIQRTSGYCAQLRQLINSAGLTERVHLFVESEEFDVSEYDSLLRDAAEVPCVAQYSQPDIRNVARFLGRQCTPAEAVARTSLYQRTTIVTEHLLGRVVRGVRLTQRPTPQTLGFRSFPGGDARIQCGDVALRRSAHGRAVPVLLTDRNIDSYECARLNGASFLPSTISHLTIVWPRA